MSEDLRVAVPSDGPGGLDSIRSGHFGHSDCFTIVDVKNGEIASVNVVENPPHDHGGCMRPVQLLASHGVNAIVVAGMGARPLAGFNEADIQVLFDNTTPGVGDVLALLVNGGLTRMDSRDACGGH